MKQVILFYLIMLLAAGPQATLYAQAKHPNIPNQPEDTSRFSLLTCAAGEEIYTLFGHTAIRYEDPIRGIDIVFNYGVFSFNVPNFALRFALGETDYQLGITDYQRFAAEYTFYGRKVWQQTLNLSSEEKRALWESLSLNYQPKNRVYRYNFFYDNCATRPRDRIESCVHGKVKYTEDTDSTTLLTWRDLLHQYTEGHPWSRLGIDLCIGSDADRPISFRNRMFVPFYVQKYFRKACIVDKNGEERPLITAENLLIDATPDTTHLQLLEVFTPFRASLLLFIGVTIATLFGLKKRKSFWILDLLLFGAAGLAGCILAFLAGCSQHPAVSPNWLLFVLHPLHLCCLPWMLIRVKKQQSSRYLLANLIVLTLFIALLAVIPQFIPAAVLPLALCLLVRSISNLVLSHTKNCKKS